MLAPPALAGRSIVLQPAPAGAAFGVAAVAGAGAVCALALPANVNPITSAMACQTDVVNRFASQRMSRLAICRCLHTIADCKCCNTQRACFARSAYSNDVSWLQRTIGAVAELDLKCRMPDREPAGGGAGSPGDEVGSRGAP